MSKLEKPELWDKIVGSEDCWGWKSYEMICEAICFHFQDKTTYSDSIPSAPDTSKFRATRSGFIEVRSEYTHRGGYYGFDRYLPYAVVVGSNVDKETRKTIQGLVEYLVHLTKDILVVTSDGQKKKGHFHDSYGTNFSTFGLAF